MRNALVAGILACAVFCCGASLQAHVMSMSNGELTVEDSAAKLTFSLPLYEVAEIASPESTLLDAFRLFDERNEAERVSGGCAEDSAQDAYRCEAEYRFPEPPEEIEVECRLASVTVPNHVHILRIVRGEFSDQKVFDYSFTRHGVRFVPPSMLESLISEGGVGVMRVLTGPAQILFLLALAVAGRNRPELIRMGLAFLAVQSAGAVVVEMQGWLVPPRFVETAGALTVAYLAVETLALPEAGARWLVAAGMGAFHGLYFGTFLQQSEISAAKVLAGAASADAALLAIFGALSWRLKQDFGEKLFVKTVSGMLLAIGLGWFLLRVWS